MFIVELTYIQPLAVVDQFVAEHREFLERHYASGQFLLSGRKEPRTGGFILANVASRDVLEAILQQDPFQREAVAQYTVTEFLPSMAAPALVGLLAS
ncbi:YciI family protein [Undibacterium sp. Di27W]|uniref:YciI family protein n=1 Tax=Undibacterium sp. Di27W TaxID=3413036 RepID=UPI003BEF62FC